MSEITTTPRTDTVTPGDLLNMLADRRDPDFVRAMGELLLKMEDRQAERALTQDLHAVQKAMPAIPRRGKIQLGQGKGEIPFAKLGDVMAAAQPLLDQYGMTISHTMIPANDKLIVRTILRHPLGATMSVDMVLPVDTGPGRNTTQAHMSSDSYGQRRGVKALLNIRDEDAADDDGSSAHYKTLAEEQAKELADLLKAGGASEPALLQHFYGDACRSLEEAPAADYGKLKQAIEARNRAVAKKRQEEESKAGG